MAITHRKGNYNDYDPSRMRPAEFGVTLANDPKAVDGKAVHIAFAAGEDKTLMTFEDAEKMIEIATEEATSTAEAWAAGTKNGIDVGSGDPQYHNNAKYYAEQMEYFNLVATGDGTVTITLSLDIPTT